MGTEIVRELVNGEWTTTVGQGGGGAAPDLSAVLAEGNDAGGEGMTDVGGYLEVVPQATLSGAIDWLTRISMNATTEDWRDNDATDAWGFVVYDDDGSTVIAGISTYGFLRATSNSTLNGITNNGALSNIGGVNLFRGDNNIYKITALNNDSIKFTLEDSQGFIVQDSDQGNTLMVLFESSGNFQVGKNADSTLGFFGASGAARQAHIADPSGGGVQDAESRAAIASILNALEAYNLLAAS